MFSIVAGALSFKTSIKSSQYQDPSQGSSANLTAHYLPFFFGEWEAVVGGFSIAVRSLSFRTSLKSGQYNLVIPHRAVQLTYKRPINLKTTCKKNIKATSKAFILIIINRHTGLKINQSIIQIIAAENIPVCLNLKHVFLYFSGNRGCLGDKISRDCLFQFLFGVLQKYQLLPEETGKLPPLTRGYQVVSLPKDYKIRFVPRS